MTSDGEFLFSTGRRTLGIRTANTRADPLLSSTSIRARAAVEDIGTAAEVQCKKVVVEPNVHGTAQSVDDIIRCLGFNKNRTLSLRNLIVASFDS